MGAGSCFFACPAVLYAEQPAVAAHWSNAPPRRAPLPVVNANHWAQRPIDFYVLARMDEEGLVPSPPADRYALVRRVYLDLIGLPPTVAEVDAFLLDNRPDAYARLVDRLLDSQHFGERWARWWLDLARFADTNGYEDDMPRPVWLYRNWVINALNRNMPFDLFTIKQLAGDLLPNATQDDRCATGFHRNTLINTENGAKEDEFRDAAIKDRVNTTFTVWMASTIECAGCHTHKYDPIDQREYYQVYAFFNNTTERHTKRNDEFWLSDTVEVCLGDAGRLADLSRRATEKQQQFEARAASVAGEAVEIAWEAALTTEQIDAFPNDIRITLTTLRSARTDHQRELIRGHFLSTQPLLAEQRTSLEEAEAQLEAFRKTFVPKQIVLREGEMRPTHRQNRGNFLDLAEAVQASVPECFGLPVHFENPDSPSRLDLARWLVHPSNPRPARVIMNHVWNTIFGRGLITTLEDFGVQGERPTHPELLDWLAVEFVAQDWDLKAMIRMMVTSATYRQSAAVSPEQLVKDPYNRFYARAPRFRMEAEMIRDVGLTASGLLCRRVGGPSVFPPQPAVVYELLFKSGGYNTWPTSEGADRYRRGVYTFIKRTSIHPMLRNFDATNRTVCVVGRRRSNTPLAALNLLNDEQFLEMAGELGRRMMVHEGSEADRLTFGFRCCVSRPPDLRRELQPLEELFAHALKRFDADGQAANDLVKSAFVDGPPGQTSGELAAWIVVANVLLNMDATITRG